MSNNPLLTNSVLPPFNKIKIEHIEPAIDSILENNRKKISELLQQPAYTWQNLMQPLEDISDSLTNAWSPVRHLHAVMSSPELRQTYSHVLPKLTEYGTEVSQNVNLYNAVNSIAICNNFSQLSTAQKKIIENELRDFRLAGVHLPEQQKQRYAELNKKLAQLTTQFEEHLLDATQAWTYTVTDEKELSGLPALAIASAAQAAKAKNIKGWLFTLEMPSYQAVMTYADSAKFREQMYFAFVTRASDLGPNAGKFDNSKVMNEILKTRHEMAQLLGFQNFAEYSLATKMAKTPHEVLSFLEELANASLAKAKQDFAELSQFAKQNYGVDQLQPWDVAYYSEKLRQHLFNFTSEELRPYFPENQVLHGMFEVVHRLYGINIKEIDTEEKWHKNVRLFAIYDEQKELRGKFYLDLYARTNKRGGAWMDESRIRRKLTDGSIQTPVTYLTCNLNPPVNDEPALFNHDEVQTLFHEFGHGLQHMLTKIDYAGVSGINGIPWDAVEIASQFMESWCWEKPGIDLIARHYKTGEKLPDELFTKMLNAKNFQSAMQMVRQLEFAIFDFRLHKEFDPTIENQIQKILDEVRQKITVVPIAKFNRFQHSFSHIFAGGYAAGYYSYKWAEVLACDAFSKFEENGIFDHQTGLEFLQCILEPGGSVDPMELFIKFRGRPPKIDALLRQNGIIN